jgi:hypothetical protein
MAKENITRTCKEKGVVISKIFKGATNQFTDSTGKTVPAQPDRRYVKVVSSDKFTQENGFEKPAIMEFKVEQEEYDRFKYLSPVIVTFEFGTYGNKPISVESAKKE